MPSPRDDRRPDFIEGMPRALYDAECRSAVDEIEEALRLLRRDYATVVFLSAMLVVLKRAVSVSKGCSTAEALAHIARWSSHWKDRVR